MTLNQEIPELSPPKKRRGRPPRNTLPPEHIGNMSAGHERDEELKRRADALAQGAEVEDAAAPSGSIDPSKFSHIDNEVAQGINLGTGRSNVSDLQPGYRYCWAPFADGYGHDAQISIRNTHSSLRNDEQGRPTGWHVVQGDMPEGVKSGHKGAFRCAGSTMRGWADCVFYRIKEEDYQRLMAKDRERVRGQGLVEERFVALGDSIFASRGYPNTASANLNDPRFGPGAGRPVTVKTQFDEGDLRRGSIQGFEPGAEVRR